ncbi:hypothetical protein CON44_29615, partial [Bacillus cereus]
IFFLVEIGEKNFLTFCKR